MSASFCMHCVGRQRIINYMDVLYVSHDNPAITLAISFVLKLAVRSLMIWYSYHNLTPFRLKWWDAGLVLEHTEDACSIVYGSLGDHTTTTAQFPCYPGDGIYDLYSETEIGTTERLWRHMYSLVLLSMYIRKYPLIYSWLFLLQVLSVAWGIQVLRGFTTILRSLIVIIMALYTSILPLCFLIRYSGLWNIHFIFALSFRGWDSWLIFTKLGTNVVTLLAIPSPILLALFLPKQMLAVLNYNA